MFRNIFRTGFLPSNRLEALSDGVFAIVMTLLVIEIRVPHLGENGHSESLLQALFHLIPKIRGFVMSFFVISIYWVAHSHLFYLIKRVDRGLMWLNGLFLMCLSFIPFPTAVLGEYPQERASAVLFGLAMMMTGVSFCLLRFYAVKWGKLVDSKIPDELLRGSLKRSLANPVLYGFGTALTFFSADTAVTFFFLIPILFILPGKLEKTVHHGEGPLKRSA
jgi:uncharacterized membrane protein